MAVAPLLIYWFDPGLGSVAILRVYRVGFSGIANTLTGLRSTDPVLLDLFKLYGSGPSARLWKLQLPSALPSMFTGLRVAAGLAVIGTVVAEFLVGTIVEHEGLGVKIYNASRNGHTDRVFAAVLLASILGSVLFGAVNLAGSMFLRRWHASERGRPGDSRSTSGAMHLHTLALERVVRAVFAPASRLQFNRPDSDTPFLQKAGDGNRDQGNNNEQSDSGDDNRNCLLQSGDSSTFKAFRVAMFRVVTDRSRGSQHQNMGKYSGFSCAMRRGGTHV